MRTSALGLATIVLVMIAHVVDAFGVIGGNPGEAVVRAREVITDNWNLSTIESTTQLPALIKELQTKTYTELYIIKYSEDDQVCILIKCYNFDTSRVTRLADAILSAREKEDSARAASINSTIAISGAILAILSFILSASSTIITLRSKKSANA